MLAEEVDGSKWCTGCSQLLAPTRFAFKYLARGIRFSDCRDCRSKIAHKYYERDPATYKARAAANNVRIRASNRLRLHEYLARRVCAACGVGDFAVLEFDHREQQQKRRDVSNMVQKAISWSTILAEIAKCDVLCANCHRRRTARQFGSYKLVGVGELELPALPRRGTANYEQIKNRRKGLRRRHHNRSVVLAYLREHPCELCGIDDPVVLEFDHRGEKLADVARLVIVSSTARLLAEMAKCRVLCANCHRRHTARAAGRLR